MMYGLTARRGVDKLNHKSYKGLSWAGKINLLSTLMADHDETLPIVRATEDADGSVEVRCERCVRMYSKKSQGLPEVTVRSMIREAQYERLNQAEMAMSVNMATLDDEEIIALANPKAAN